jgi:hypothetical protein
MMQAILGHFLARNRPFLLRTLRMDEGLAPTSSITIDFPDFLGEPSRAAM